MLKKLRLYVSPFFLSRFYIRRDIQNILKKYKFTGDILDNGCGEKPYQKLFTEYDSYKGIDFEEYSPHKEFSYGKPDFYYGDEYRKNLVLPFEGESFDHCVAFQVLEHHPNPQKFISEMARVTKPGGYLLMTAPFLGGLHELPHDYQRLTQYGIEVLLKAHGYEPLIIKGEGSLFSTISLLLNEHLVTSIYQGKVKRILGLLIYPLFVLFAYVALLLDAIIKSEKIVFNYIVLAQKRVDAE